MTINIHDDAGTFSPADVTALQTAAAQWPFDVQVITSSSLSKSALESRVHKAVDEPGVVAIGLDPTHKNVVVHFGKGVGVTPSQWSSISSAGNSAFKEARWADGVVKIAEKTIGLRTQTSTTQSTPAQIPGPATNSNTGWWIFGTVVLVVAIGGFFWWKNKRREEEHERKIEELDEEIAEKRVRNMEEEAWADKFRDKAREVSSKPRRSNQIPDPPPPAMPPPAPAMRPVYVAAPAAPTTVVVNQTSSSGGNGDLLTGYALGSLSARRDRVYERDVYVEREVRSRRRYDDDDDTGGASSSFGSSSSVSDDDDSGGSASSFGNDDNDDGGSSSSFSDDD